MNKFSYINLYFYNHHFFIFLNEDFYSIKYYLNHYLKTFQFNKRSLAINSFEIENILESEKVKLFENIMVSEKSIDTVKKLDKNQSKNAECWWEFICFEY